MVGHHDVVVVGAGLAGLRCATDLVAAGLDVVVLESRDRVGGRVWSHRFTDGQTCERGAEFIDSNHAEVLALAADLGLRWSERPESDASGSTLIDTGGRPVPPHLHATLATDLERWEDTVAALDPTDEFESASLADLLSGLGLSAVSRAVIGRDVRTEYMLPPAEVSQRFAAQIAAVQQADCRERHRIVGGNDQLATGLADRLGVLVRTSTPVAAIDPVSGEVRLVEGGVLTADTIVAALPLPVLSRLWASMPAELATVGYGIGGKVSVQFGRRVWLDYGRNGTVLSDRAWGHLWETTDDQPGDHGVLTALMSSNDGAAFVALPGSEEQVVAEIDRIFPGARGLAGERVRTDWTDDSSSLGCYACFGPGQWRDAQRALHEQHGRMWIAGEHADGFAGFMEGALRSGRRVARRITG